MKTYFHLYDRNEKTEYIPIRLSKHQQQKYDKITSENVNQIVNDIFEFSQLDYECKIKSKQTKNKQIIKIYWQHEYCNIIHKAAQLNKYEIVKQLLEYNDVDLEDEDYITPLMYATNTNSVETCKLLLKSNANPNAQDKHDWTPLHYAICSVSTEATKILLKYNCDTTLANKNNKTPLQMA
jgi:ankyrin repeat protein